MSQLPAPSAQFAVPVPVIGPQFCAPYEVTLAIVRRVLKVMDGNFVVTDVNGAVIFRVSQRIISLRSRRVLLDGAGNPVVTLRGKITTVHDRWRVYRGESVEESDLIFSVKRTSMVQLRVKLNVFLANNTNEEVGDFRVEANFSESSCVVYTGQSSSEVAKMEQNKTVRSVLFGKDHFNVKINRNIDHAFIVALVVILDAIPSQLAIARSIFEIAVGS
ncbi:protein LURP-one-related 15-like [Alnus glutinosa]|uniref:protein LURP-one-related 15-like n=1 Tax=Alnus glutinosa TaxID=3517 RepID=UPI002D785B9F|nr:protein LURP-one-related 15-like [Alnus glutinosa]